MNTQPNRTSYWSQRYQNSLDWRGGVHIGKFDGLDDRADLKTACDAADDWLIREIAENSSLYRIVTGLNILEVGCGVGELARKLATRLPNINYLGFDVSESAIDTARSISVPQESHQHTMGFQCQDINSIEEFLRTSNGPSKSGFDLFIIREVFYLLSTAERRAIGKIIQEYARPGACVFFSDLFVNREERLGDIKRYLYQRHFSQGDPLKIDGDPNMEMVRWIREAMGISLALCNTSGHPAVNVDTESIKKTYECALKEAISNSENTEAYKTLANLADSQNGDEPHLVYISALFYIPPISQETAVTPNQEIGFIADRDWNGIFTQGHKYALKRNKWNLLVGRSGSGKTSFLNAIANGWKVAGGKNGILEAENTFFLTQDIDVFENLSPIENVSAFNGNRVRSKRLLQKMGFSSQVLAAKSCKNLSGGERQRVALAQSIASECEILILDEPYRGLDKTRRFVLFDIIDKEWSSNRDNQTLICIDHDFELIHDKFDHKFEMIHGQMIEMTDRVPT